MKINNWKIVVLVIIGLIVISLFNDNYKENESVENLKKLKSGYHITNALATDYSYIGSTWYLEYEYKVNGRLYKCLLNKTGSKKSYEDKVGSRFYLYYSSDNPILNFIYLEKYIENKAKPLSEIDNELIIETLKNTKQKKR